MIGVVLTTKFKAHLVGTHVMIPQGEGGLPRQSYAMPEHLRTLSHKRLISLYGKVAPQTVSKVLEKIKVLLHIV